KDATLKEEAFWSNLLHASAVETKDYHIDIFAIVPDVLILLTCSVSPRPAERDPRHYACGCIRGYRRLSRLRRFLRKAPQERWRTVAEGGAWRNPRRGCINYRRVLCIFAESFTFGSIIIGRRMNRRSFLKTGA